MYNKTVIVESSGSVEPKFVRVLDALAQFFVRPTKNTKESSYSRPFNCGVLDFGSVVKLADFILMNPLNSSIT